MLGMKVKDIAAMEGITPSQAGKSIHAALRRLRRYLDVYKRQGLLYCADCGGKMYVHRTNNGKRVSQYTCSNYTKDVYKRQH